jgi:anthranilate synthase component 2
LGVCLGMQAINEVFGGVTVKAPEPMHGKTSFIWHNQSGIFKNIPNPTCVARYHSLMCKNINPLFELQSQVDGVPMAMRIPQYISAVQFHPESFLTEHGQLMINNFLERSI